MLCKSIYVGANPITDSIIARLVLMDEHVTLPMLRGEFESLISLTIVVLCPIDGTVDMLALEASVINGV